MQEAQSKIKNPIEERKVKILDKILKDAQHTITNLIKREKVTISDEILEKAYKSLDLEDREFLNRKAYPISKFKSLIIYCILGVETSAFLRHAKNIIQIPKYQEESINVTRTIAKNVLQSEELRINKFQNGILVALKEDKENSKSIQSTIVSCVLGAAFCANFIKEIMLEAKIKIKKSKRQTLILNLKAEKILHQNNYLNLCPDYFKCIEICTKILVNDVLLAIQDFEIIEDKIEQESIEPETSDNPKKELNFANVSTVTNNNLAIS